MSLKMQKTGASNMAAGLQFFRIYGAVYELGGRRGAVGIERSREFLGDRRRGRGLDRRALHQVHQLPVAQNCDRRRGWRVSAKVAPSLLRGLAVLPRNTVTEWSGFAECCIARRTPGRILPAAQPQM